MTTNTPTKDMQPPTMSPISGLFPSNNQPNKKDMHIKNPPYTAYILPKLSVGCKHGMNPYIINVVEPNITKYHGFLGWPRMADHTHHPPIISAQPASMWSDKDWIIVCVVH